MHTPRAILNGGGRMARAIHALAADRGLGIAGVVSPQRPDWLGQETHASSLAELGASADVVVDFSLPAGTLAAAGWCQESRLPLLSGVTGLDRGALAALDGAAAVAPVLWSPNLSLGVNLLEALCRTVAGSAGSPARVQIHDVHHRWKKDQPSGTALALGRAIELAGPGGLEVEYSSEREGEVIGRHRVRFELEGEVLELAHEALDRAIFARGAIDAAIWLCSQPPGRYRASDWLAGRTSRAERG